MLLPFGNVSNSFLSYTDNVEKAADFLKRGLPLIYPTETLYAIGCPCSAQTTIEKILKLKNRSEAKTLSLLAANLNQAARYCHLELASKALLEKFWPGPLTLILPAKIPLHPALLDKKGRIAIRVSSSPLAAQLALDCNEALIASSANLGGNEPATCVEKLDPAFLAQFERFNIKAAIMASSPNSFSGIASTIVEIIPVSASKSCLRILRQGSITKEDLAAENLDLFS